MILNPSTTKPLLLTGKRLVSQRNLYPRTPYGNIINQVKSETLLGVTIDSNLNFNEHIDKLCKKCHKGLPF